MIPSVASADDDTPVFYLVSSISKSKVYVGECAYYSIKLYSSSPDVSNLRLVAENPEQNTSGLVFENLGNESDSWTKEKYKGRDLYAINVATYIVKGRNPGNFKFGGNKYSLSFAVPVVSYDPFWGDVKRYVRKNYSVESDMCRLKVEKLPSQFASLPIGSFVIETSVPPGYIKPGDTSLAVVTIEGNGSMPDVESLNIQDVFARSGLKLVETRPSMHHYMKEGKRISELEIECTFVAPEATEYTIVPIEFKFLDSEGHKVKIAKSEAVTFEAGKVSNNYTPPVIQEI